jgi:hypothetical protein
MRKCHHGFDLDSRGYHIIPEPKKEPKKSTAELIEEAKKLLRQKEPNVVPTPKPLTKQEQAFQASVNKWQKYFEENKGKIPNNFPRSIFDNEK